MCYKKAAKETLEYAKPLGFSATGIAFFQIPGHESPWVIYLLIDIFKVLVPAAAFVYTIVKTYYLIKNGRKNGRI
jgi:hypothetical protein